MRAPFWKPKRQVTKKHLMGFHGKPIKKNNNKVFLCETNQPKTRGFEGKNIKNKHQGSLNKTLNRTEKWPPTNPFHRLRSTTTWRSPPAPSCVSSPGMATGPRLGFEDVTRVQRFGVWLFVLFLCFSPCFGLFWLFPVLFCACLFYFTFYVFLFIYLFFGGGRGCRFRLIFFPRVLFCCCCSFLG